MKKVWLAEDDADDQEIFSEIILGIDQAIDLTITDNGEALLARLSNCKDEDLPDLIVLDQNMPRLKGKETIEALRADSRLRDIPAVIYSTYHDSSFVKSCQDLNIELLLKPDTFDEFSQMIKDLVNRHIGN